MSETLPPLTPGTLYLVATPIGNLEDITLRALRTLRECDLVAAEDTRRTGQLLKHFGISKPLLSYFKFSEARRSEQLLERLSRGEKVGLVTDAGSPGISDPGERVVRAAIQAGYRVEAVPGPCALVAALTASGLPSEEFHFSGFLPHKSGQRRKKLESLKLLPGTLVLYESPYRIEKLLLELGRGIWSAAGCAGARVDQALRGVPPRYACGVAGACPHAGSQRRVRCAGRRSRLCWRAKSDPKRVCSSALGAIKVLASSRLMGYKAYNSTAKAQVTLVFIPLALPISQKPGYTR